MISVASSLAVIYEQWVLSHPFASLTQVWNTELLINITSSVIIIHIPSFGVGGDVVSSETVPWCCCCRISKCT